MGMQPIWGTKQNNCSLLEIEIYSHAKKSYCSVLQIDCIPMDLQGVYYVFEIRNLGLSRRNSRYTTGLYVGNLEVTLPVGRSAFHSTFLLQGECFSPKFIIMGK